MNKQPDSFHYPITDLPMISTPIVAHQRARKEPPSIPTSKEKKKRNENKRYAPMQI